LVFSRILGAVQDYMRMMEGRGRMRPAYADVEIRFGFGGRPRWMFNPFRAFNLRLHLPSGRRRSKLLFHDCTHHLAYGIQR